MATYSDILHLIKLFRFEGANAFDYSPFLELRY